MLTKVVEISHLESRVYDMTIIDLENARPALRSFLPDSWVRVDDDIEFEKVPDVVDDYMLGLLNKHQKGFAVQRNQPGMGR